jgi:hypothetical protein
LEQRRANGSLVLVPCIPSSISPSEVHTALCAGFTREDYETCFRNPQNKETVVILASAELVQKYRGHHFGICGGEYRFEYTTHHSKDYV